MTTIVIAGILLMVLAANLLAMRLRSAPRWLYLPLLATLLLIFFVPRDWVLGHDFLFRLGWSLIIMPSPTSLPG